MKLLTFILFLMSCLAAQGMDFTRLAYAIDLHENNPRFPFGISRKVRGELRLEGYSYLVAKKICIATCQKCTEPVTFDKLARMYLGENRSAKDYQNWSKSVKWFYEKGRKTP